MLRRLIQTLVLAAALPGPALAGERAWGEILTGWREADGAHMSGLAIGLAPGWKTYWRAPGDGGIPPRFNWSGSANLADVEVFYPTPKVMTQYGVTSIGYDSDVVFPLVVTARDASKPVRLSAEVEIGICEEVCIPFQMRIEAVLPAGGVRDARIARAMADQPEDGGRFACEIKPIVDGLKMEARAVHPGFTPEIAVIEPGKPGVWTSPADMGRAGDRLTATVEMVPPNAKPFALARSEVRLTFIGEGRAVQMTGCE